MEKSIYHSSVIYNHFKQLNLCQVFSYTTINHIMAILISVFALGYKGKTVNFASYGPCHRTTLAHFLNHGKWDDFCLETFPELKFTYDNLLYACPYCNISKSNKWPSSDSNINVVGYEGFGIGERR